MTRPAKPKGATDKTAGSTKAAVRKSNDKKPLHEALGPAAKDFGLEVKPLGKEVGELTVKAVRTLLIKPLTSTIWGLENVSEWISTRVSEKLAGKTSDEIKEPNPRIALPTLQALIYSGDDETIREMFASLLASEMTKDASSMTHPAFVELIKQMTADDAKVLSHVHENPNQCKFEARLSSNENPGSYYVFASNLSFAYQDSERGNEDLFVSLSNLERLGLITVDSQKYPNVDSVNNAIANLKKMYAEQVKLEKYTIEMYTYGIYITALGQRFVKICLPSKKVADVSPATGGAEVIPNDVSPHGSEE